MRMATETNPAAKSKDYEQERLAASYRWIAARMDRILHGHNRNPALQEIEYQVHEWS